jgi:hypothetical protein
MSIYPQGDAALLEGIADLARLIAEPDAFEALIDTLPESVTTICLKMWGVGHGFYPEEKMLRAAAAFYGEGGGYHTEPG